MSEASSVSALLRAPLAFARSQAQAWFGPSDPRVLAICRVLVFWYVWPGFSVADYTPYTEFERWAWYPIKFFGVWSISPPSAGTVAFVSLACSVASLFALLGFLYPLSAPVAALASLYLRGLPQNFGKVDHSENLLVLALLVLSVARAADVWSFDAGLRRLLKRPARSAPSGDYTWPRRFLLLLVVTMYGAAGASKLIHSGWDWALSDSFRWLLLRHHFTHQPPTRLGVWIADFPWLCHALALGALLTELGSPLSLLGRRVAALLLPALFLLQAGIWLMLGVRFRAMFPLFYCLLPWPFVLEQLDRARARVGGLIAARRAHLA